MLFTICPHSACAAKTSYDTIKPTVCPQCRKTFASAFVVATPSPVAGQVMHVPVDYVPDERPLGRPAPARHQTAVARARPGRPEPSRLMNPSAGTQPVFPADGADEDDEPIDPREVRRQARELAATIDMSAIHVNANALGQGDKPIRGEVFRGVDIWAQGAAAREAAVQAQAQPTKPKRKARR